MASFFNRASLPKIGARTRTHAQSCAKPINYLYQSPAAKKPWQRRVISSFSFSLSYSAVQELSVGPRITRINDLREVSGVAMIRLHLWLKHLW
jgi:hypothetical protein